MAKLCFSFLLFYFFIKCSLELNINATTFTTSTSTAASTTTTTLKPTLKSNASTDKESWETTTISSFPNKDEQRCFTKKHMMGVCRTECPYDEREKSSKCGPSEFCCTYKEVNMFDTSMFNISISNNTSVFDDNNIDEEVQECGERPEMAAIVGGFESEPNTWPWSVAVYEKTSSGPFFICGGVILDELHILSAAHCFARTAENLRPRKYLVKIGAHSLSMSDRFEEISKIKTHEKYNDVARYNDIAMIKLKYAIKLNPTLAPACLPDKNVDRMNLDGKMATIIGWGAMSWGGAVSDTLREVDIPIVSNRICNRDYSVLSSSQSSFPYGITNNFICAGFTKGGKDSCQGDSGGPLLMKIQGKYTVLGVVSFGYKCAEPNFPGVYTRVSYFRKWIEKHLQ